MRSRFARLVAVAGGIAALVGGLAPQPAQAFTTSSVEFVANVAVIGGIGYPVLTLPEPPDPTPLECLPLKTGPPNCHPVYDHPRPVAVGAVLCQNEVENVKPNKPPFHAGACGFTSVDTSKPNPPENTVTGHCGLSGGQVTVLFTDALGQDFLLDIHFTGVTGDLVLDGHWFKLDGSGQHGLIVGDAVAIPPTPQETPGQSCMDKSATDFLVPGAAVAVTDPTLGL